MIAEHYHIQQAEHRLGKLKSFLGLQALSDQAGMAESLFSELPLQSWKQELQQLKEQDPEAAERKEIEIVTQIQAACEKLPYQMGSGTPEQIIENGSANCEGKTIIGSLIMDEICIDHRIFLAESAASNSPGHALILPVSCKKNIFWGDMTDLVAVEQISANMFSMTEGPMAQDELGRLFETKSTLSLLLSGEEYKKRVGSGAFDLLPPVSMRVHVFKPSIGRQVIILQRSASNELQHAMFAHDRGEESQAYNQSAKLYLMLIDMGIEMFEYFNKLAYIQNAVGAYEAEVNTRKRLTDMRPNSINDLGNLGKAQVMAGQKVEGEQTLLTASQIRPGVYQGLQFYVEFLLVENRVDEAQVQVSHFIDVYQPTFLTPYLDLLSCYVKRGEDNKAFELAAALKKQYKKISFKEKLKLLEINTTSSNKELQAFLSNF